ncbi:hypothetical protein [Ammoniphilus sp. 3BR4]|uniref:hypothetical protein n=1 Tax=Ammoniphilus sp. 3BR4 TaxID=3158265 RepID=UPI0034658DAA
MQPERQSSPKPPSAASPLNLDDPLESSPSTLIQVSEQMRTVRQHLQELEASLVTLSSIIEAMKQSRRTSAHRGRWDTDLIKDLQNLDFKQVMSLLQSPLVQDLVEFLAQEEARKQK